MLERDLKPCCNKQTRPNLLPHFVKRPLQTDIRGKDFSLGDIQIRMKLLFGTKMFSKCDVTNRREDTKTFPLLPQENRKVSLSIVSKIKLQIQSS